MRRNVILLASLAVVLAGRPALVLLERLEVSAKTSQKLEDCRGAECSS